MKPGATGPTRLETPAPGTTGPVPPTVHVEGETVVVDRAWPSVRRSPDGTPVIRVEGRDTAGRLRAGRIIHDRALTPRAGSDGSTHGATLTAYGTDRRLPALAAAVAEGGAELVVHRIGRRAVVRRDDRYLKVLRPGAASRTVAHRSRLGAEIAAAAGFDTPRVLAYTDGRLDLSVLSGTSMHDASSAGDAVMSPTAWRAAWDAWAQAWPRFASTAGDGPGDERPGDERPGDERPGDDGPGLPTHTAEDELAGLRTWLDHVRAVDALPDLERELVSRCAVLADELAASPADPLVVSHRDLHDKQLLWNGSSVGLLDLDTLARAEPACDLANLAVHAELRTHQGLWDADRRDVVLARVDDVARALGVSPRRMAAYAEATRLRLTMLYAFRPRWAPHTADWLHERSLIPVSSSAALCTATVDGSVDAADSMTTTEGRPAR